MKESQRLHAGGGMKYWLFLFVAFVVVVIITAGTPYRTTHEIKSPARLSTTEEGRARADMDSVIFPQVVLTDVPMDAAVRWVRSQIPLDMPIFVPARRREISMVCQTREGTPEPVKVSMKSATLPEVLDAICAQHDYVWSLQAHALSVIPRERVGR